jgi:hypothetical protein
MLSPAISLIAKNIALNQIDKDLFAKYNINLKDIDVSRIR